MPKRGARVSYDVSALSLFEKGDSFFEAGALLGSVPDDYPKHQFAHVTCFAFALEAWLKVIAIEQKKVSPLRTHDLLELFDDIPSEAQQLIEETWKVKCLAVVVLQRMHGLVPRDTPTTLRASLERSRDAFTAWRYSDDPIEWHLGGLMSIVRDYVLETVPAIRHSYPSTESIHSEIFMKAKKIRSV